jgi:hypothetical protein
MFVAFQHALLAASLDRIADRTPAAGVGLVTRLSGNLGIGFAAGAAALAVRNLLTHGRALRPRADRVEVAAGLG